MDKTTTTDAHLTLKATRHVTDILALALRHTDEAAALVIYDTNSPLACILTAAYRTALPHATFVDFNSEDKEALIARFDTLAPRDLVVLIQSMDFRLNAFRIRIQLFQRKLKVIDHQHLERNTPDSWETYIDALAYDTAWYHGVGKKLKGILESTQTLRIISNEYTLTVRGGLEVPKLNIGDYTEMENIGGTFPIGEVFTEAQNLSAVDGSLVIYAFANTDFHMCMHEPFRIDIKEGLVVGWSTNAPTSFGEVIAQIKTNERAIIRELGFGLNRAITREKYVQDITAFERILGLHVSLGEKHTVYKKAGITPDKTRFHVDVFPVVTEVYADDTLIFNGETYTV